MSQSGTLNDGNGGDDVLKIVITDDGEAIPVNNELEILGEPANSVPVVTTHGSGNVVTIEDRTWETQYVVDPDSTVGLRGTFQTIQSAIDQAVIDGATLGNYKIIRLRSTTYTENLIIPGGIIIVGENLPYSVGGTIDPSESSVVIGNHVFTGNAVGGFKDVNFLAASEDIFSGGDIVLWYSSNCIFFNQGPNRTFNITASSSYLSFIDCQFSGVGNLISLTSSKLFMEGCNFPNHGSIQSLSSTIILECCFGISNIICTTSILDINYCKFLGVDASYNISGTASGSIYACSFSSPTIAGVQSTITAEIVNCSCTTPASVLFENGHPYLYSISQQGSIVQGKNVTITTQYAVERGDHYLGINNTIPNGAVILLDNSIGQKINQGQEFIIKDITGNAATNNIVISTVGGVSTIDGQLTAVINVNYGSITVRFDGTNYYII